MGYDFSQLSLMVVDDNPHMRKLIREILIGFNIRNVRSFNNANEVMEEIESNSFDLALIDWQMEPVSGIDLARWIRNSPKSPDPYLPIIMVTGHTERHRVEMARDIGVTEFLAKPLSGLSVYGKLAQIIEHPRDFVDAPDYFGPDRRRRHDEDMAKRARRKDDPEIDEKDRRRNNRHHGSAVIEAEAEQGEDKDLEQNQDEAQKEEAQQEENKMMGNADNPMHEGLKTDAPDQDET